MNKTDKINHKNFINRELSWLEFNDRVLSEAGSNSNNPILEKLKFLSIVSSNLDEFFMVRAASIYDKIEAGFIEPDASGLSPKEQMALISSRVHRMVSDQYKYYEANLLPQLKNQGILFLKENELNERQKDFISSFYKHNIYPVLTPMVVDRSRPFPLVLNKTLNIALLLDNEDENDKDNLIFGMVQVPSVLDRYVRIPSESGLNCFILLEDVIKMNIDTLFTGHKVITMACYRVTRNTDQGLDEEDAEDLLEAIQEFIKKRKWGMVIRLELEQNMDSALLNILKEEFEVPEESIYDIKGPLDLTYLMKISSLPGYDHLRYEACPPLPAVEFMDNDDIFDAISKKDIMLHHPYQSFDPVINMVKQAAADPNVLAIKQTLYRVSGNSPIVEALAQAAENGKQVTVLVELKARFDEQNNILWAKRLEMAGCHVIYGLVGLKTHCKILLIVRMEEDGIKRYVHLGTGNYNDITARFYTDIGLFTVNPYFGADASALFNMLSGYSRLTNMYKLEVAPVSLRDKFTALIRQEAENAKKDKPSHIIAKFNSLVDEKIIQELYRASKLGVKIELIVRGICCLKPGIKGLSENITVRSIVGRYLEHSRIFYFYNGGEELMFLSSADWMARNLDRRVEILFPVEDSEIFNNLKGILNLYLKDNTKARLLNKDGKYLKVQKRSKQIIHAQRDFYTKAATQAQMVAKDKNVIKDLI